MCFSLLLRHQQQRRQKRKEDGKGLYEILEIWDGYVAGVTITSFINRLNAKRTKKDKMSIRSSYFVY